MGKKFKKLTEEWVELTGKHIGFVALFSAMSLVPKLLQAYYIHRLHHVPLAVFPPFFTAIFLVYLVRHCRPRLKTAFLTAVLFLQSLFFLVEMFVLDFQHLMLNSAIMSPVMETSWREAVEFIRTYVGWPVFLALAALLLLSALAQRLSMRVRSSRKGLCALMGCIIVLGFLTTAREIIQGGQENSVRESWISLPVAVGGAYFEHRSIAKAQGRLDQAPNHIMENGADIPDVVLIIGESESRHHMQSYGYALPTTPLAEKWRQRGNLTVFRDVVSAYSTTNPSLQHLFTFANYENSERKWYDQSNLIDIVKNAGYRAVWISSKDYKLAGSGMNWVFAARADVIRFTSDGGNYEGFGDWKLVPMLEEEIEKGGEKNFYVMHLMGSHANYPGRYPADYAKFTADDIKKLRADRNAQAQEIAAYDNTVLYTDEYLDKVYRQFVGKDAIVIYLPDHGEDVYDGSASFAGHNPNGDKWQIEIPFFVWLSDAFQEKRPDLSAAVQSAAERPFMTDDLIHLVLDLMSIETEETDKSRSPVNAAYNAARKRIYQSKDYDAQMK